MGIILSLVALDILAAERQRQKREAKTGNNGAAEPNNFAVYTLTIPIPTGPSAILSVIVVTGGFIIDGLERHRH